MSSPNKSFRSRMGGVMRRTSSVLAISRPGTPTPSGSPAPPSDEGRRSSISKSVEGRKSTASLTPSGATPPAPVAPPEPQPQPQLPTIAVDPTLEVAPAPPPESVPEPASAPAPAPAPEPEPEPEPERAAPPSSEEVPTPTPPPAAQANGTHKAVKRLLPIAAQYQMYPSPIAESPAREAAASEEELAATRAAAAEVAAQRLLEGDSVPAADAPVPEPAPQATEPEPVAIPQPQVKEEQAYVPPPLIGDSSNPGAFTDEPEEMSIPRPEPAPAPAEVAAPEPALPEPTPAPVAVLVVEQPIPVSEPPAPIPVIAPIAPAVEPSPALDDYAYFDLVPRASVHAIAVPAGVSPASESDTIVGVDPAARQRQPDVGVSPYPYDIRPAQADDAQVEVQGEPQLSTAVEPVREIPDLEAQVRREWAGADEGGWESNAVFMPVTAATTTTQVVNEDPFADPPAPQRSQEGNLNAETEIDVPRREREADDSVFLIPIAVVDHDGDREQEGGISSIPMPVPATEFGVGAPLGFESIRTMPSVDNVSRSSQGHFLHAETVTDERRPLLSRPPSVNEDANNNGYLATGAAPPPPPTNASTEGPQSVSFHELGWIEYVLPDGAAAYYVHPTLRVTTDAELRGAEALARVGRALGYAGGGAGHGRARMEMWLRETGKGKGKGNGSANGHTKGKGGKGKGKWRGDLAELGLAKWWVDHVKREVSSGEDVVGLEDHLDMEYRYWAFMESHPAHAALPFTARREAMDVLTWAWTDRLLPPHELPLPPPFTQLECQELLGLLRSFGDVPQAETGIQSIVLTRIVSRILLRVGHWRQHHFRPHKPLPVESAGHHHLRHHARSPGFVSTAAQIFASILLLGVPYLFYTHAPFHRGDAEGGTGAGARNLLPVLAVGACTCLLAAILLSASITFLSLPGLDSVARLVALVVALLAASSMASGLVALFRYKAELGEAAQPSAAQLNPALVGREGLRLISTRSVIMSLPLVFLIYAVIGFVAAIVLYSFFGVNQSAVRFEDYTRWAVLGVLGGLVGIVTTSVVLVRR